MTSPSKSKAESGGASLANGSGAPPIGAGLRGVLPQGRQGGPPGNRRLEKEEHAQESIVDRVPAHRLAGLLRCWLKPDSRLPRGGGGGGCDPVHQQCKELLLAGQFRRQAGHLLALRVLLLAPLPVSPEELVEQGRVINVAGSGGKGGRGKRGGVGRWSGRLPSSQLRAAASQPHPAPSWSIIGDCSGPGAGAGVPSERSSRAVSRATRAAAVTSWRPCQVP